MAAEAEAMMFGGGPADGAGDEDTFLTGLMAGKKQKSEGRRSATFSAQKPPKAEARSLLGDSEMNADDIESELRDVVFDYEGSKALVLAADNFLSEGDTQSRKSGKSMRSGISSTTSKIHENKSNASKYDPFKIKLLQDRLSSPEKARLATLLKEIDDNYDALMKEKAEYHRHGMKAVNGGYRGAGAFDAQSQASGQTGATRASGAATDAQNAYIYSQGDQGRMQKINETLQKYNPALLGSQVIANDHFDIEASVISSGKKKPRGGGPAAPPRLNDDTQSMMSRDSNISAISRKSALSLIDMDSIASIASRAKKLPGERGLRANAERRMEKAQMTLIDA